MALEGFLEDLGVCDILQILSLSKKSGTLTLKSSQEEGAIVFSRGQVIRAWSTLFPEGLGQLLCRAGLVDHDQLESALQYQRKLNDHRPLGQIIADLYAISPELIETTVRNQIERIVFSFFNWSEGSFIFDLDAPPSFGSALVNPLDFMLEKGLSPQRLAIKGRNLSDQGEAPDEATIDRELTKINSRQRRQGIDLLRGMLAELEHPEFCGGIILLILRYASEIMQRAIIFDVRGRYLVGLGQFGLDSQQESADEIVRKLRLKIDKGTLFEHVLEDKKAHRGKLGESDCDRFMRIVLERIDGEVLVAPLINDGEVVAMLYGDRFVDERAQHSVDAFKVFLSRAGLALEQALMGTPLH